MRIVTSYYEPDLDGTSCMYAYSELLNKLGIESKYYIWGKPKNEVQIVCDIFNIKLDSAKEVSKDDEYVCVDLNGYNQMNQEIVTLDNLVEIIDHHAKSVYLPQYKNADVHIEKLGAAATLVAEKFIAEGVTPSREAAILLYYGIISNSILLKANITKPKDIRIAGWLKSLYSDITEERIKEIFIKKSVVEDKDLRKEMECEIALTILEKDIYCGQIEVANVNEFYEEKKDKILSILHTIKEEKKADYIYLSMVDILNGYIKLVTIDEATRVMLNNVFGYEFDEFGTCTIDHIIQRKEMTAKLRTITSFEKIM